MKKSIKKKLLIGLVSVFATFTIAGVGITFAKTAFAEEASISFTGFEMVYSLGDKIEIPADASVKYNNGLYAAENCYLIRPDGGALSGKSFSLDTVGEYTLVLEATVSGKKISAQKNFKVLKEYYTVSKEDSQVYYGELNDTYKRKKMNYGVVAELTEGATLTIAEPLNVYAAKKVDLFTFNLVRMDCDVNYLNIRLTDCYNPDIEINIQYWKRINMETYMKAGPKGGGLVGLSSDDNGQYSIGGSNYSRGIFGTGTRGNRPMNGNYNNITLSFENTEDGKIRIWSNTPEHESNPNGDDRLITEINNDKLYSTVFPGFTTGEVILSITATGFNNVKTARVEIGNIQGRTNEQLNKFGAYNDADAPAIQVSADGTDNKIIAGLEAKIPEAVAYDASGVKKLDYTVWYNYTDPNSKRAITVKDGKFLAKQKGTYTVEYRATDVYGNVATKLFDLVAFKEANEGISLVLDDKITDAEIGSSVDLSNYSVNSVCKDYNVKVMITTPNGETTDTTSSAQAYNLEEIGTYTVKYLYSDIYYDGEYSYNFKSVASDKAVFEKRSIPVPEYYIEGATYSVEDVKAYAYSGNKKKSVELNLYVSYDGGAYRKIAADGFNVEKASSLKLKLAVKEDESVYIESKDVEIVDVGYGSNSFDIAKYFVGDFAGEAKNDYTTYTSAKNGEAALKFINPLLLSNFAFTFAVGKDTEVAGMDLILTDYYDRTKTAVISLNNENGEADLVAINGVLSAIPDSWKGKTYQVTYDGASVDFNGLKTAIDFGFSSDLCLFELRFRSVRKGFSFNLSALCNQPFGAQSYDDVKPMVSAELPPVVVSVNDEFVTDIPKVADILSPSKNKCLLTVYYAESDDSDIEIFSDINGNALRELPANVNYVIKFTQYGTYTFTYAYTDGAGKTRELQQLVYVYDLVAPTIRFKEQPSSTIGVKVGEEVKPLEVVVDDNVSKTENLTVWTVIYDSRDRFIAATNETFVLKEKGYYTIYIHCKDEGGNASFVKYEVYAG